MKVALGNDPASAELNQPASESSVIPVIDAAASLHRKRSGYACSIGVNALIPTSWR
jgi:hypothetical protein